MQSQRLTILSRLQFQTSFQNKCTILSLYMVPDHLGMAKVSRILPSLSHRFLAPMSRVNRRPRQILLNANLGSKFHNVRFHIVLERKTYGWARLLEAEDSLGPEYDVCYSSLQKCCTLSE